ncbi:MAG: hypothetical protein AAGA03_10980 [Planctomycetota bacterium]
MLPLVLLGCTAEPHSASQPSGNDQAMEPSETVDVAEDETSKLDEWLDDDSMMMMMGEASDRDIEIAEKAAAGGPALSIMGHRLISFAMEDVEEALDAAIRQNEKTRAVETLARVESKLRKGINSIPSTPKPILRRVADAAGESLGQLDALQDRITDEQTRAELLSSLDAIRKALRELSNAR